MTTFESTPVEEHVRRLWMALTPEDRASILDTEEMGQSFEDLERVEAVDLAVPIAEFFCRLESLDQA